MKETFMTITVSELLLYFGFPNQKAVNTFPPSHLGSLSFHYVEGKFLGYVAVFIFLALFFFFW